MGVVPVPGVGAFPRDGWEGACFQSPRLCSFLKWFGCFKTQAWMTFVMRDMSKEKVETRQPEPASATSGCFLWSEAH